VLFTITKETKEDMEGEEYMGDHKSTFFECLSCSKSPSPNHGECRYQQQQNNYNSSRMCSRLDRSHNNNDTIFLNLLMTHQSALKWEINRS
jgi:hypothetical protein